MRPPSRPSVTVFGLSNTATNTMPPKLAKPAIRLLTSASMRSSSTNRTSTHRQYLSREAPHAVQDLDRLELGFSGEHVDDPIAIQLDRARPPDAARLRRLDVPGLLDRRLAHDPFHAAQRDSGLRRDPAQPLAPCSQYLHSMSGHGSDHPPLPPDAAGPPQSFGTARYRSPSGGQNFRKKWGQNFRNPHKSALHSGRAFMHRSLWPGS